MKVSELTGAELDYWVARADGMSGVNLHRKGKHERGETFVDHVSAYDNPCFSPSTDWRDGGPIIERERIQLLDLGNEWFAKVKMSAGNSGFGETPLIAAMRAFVASKFGGEVPDETEVA